MFLFAQNGVQCAASCILYELRKAFIISPTGKNLNFAFITTIMITMMVMVMVMMMMMG
jgi:hypothetical protein